MFLAADSLDDLLRKAIRSLLESGVQLRASKGPFSEVCAARLELSNPLNRLSRTQQKGTLFSCLGETLWYLSGSNALEHIAYYIKDYGQFSDDKRTIHGAYGPRLIGHALNYPDQLRNIERLLKEKPTSRRAVIQLFSAQDIVEDHADVPCTCVLQFLVREERLDAIVYMRSNDCFLGLPHDIFAFTFIQELMARSLGVGLGRYVHMVGSLHLYEEHYEKARRYLDEGWQKIQPMPPMPDGQQSTNLENLLKIERELRKNSKFLGEVYSELPHYWRIVSHSVV